MREKTIFQRIIDGEIDGEIVYQDVHCAVLRDIHPQAPIHVLVVPRKPIPSLNDLQPDDVELMGHLWQVIPEVARQLGIAGGYRVVVNCGAEAGQSVDHIHFHLLGGRPMTWPPG